MTSLFTSHSSFAFSQHLPCLSIVFLRFHLHPQVTCAQTLMVHKHTVISTCSNTSSTLDPIKPRCRRTSPGRLLHPGGPEGWCCSCPRSRPCTDSMSSLQVSFQQRMYYQWGFPEWDLHLQYVTNKPVYRSFELICRAFASILAPMSPIALPLTSSLVSEELLPSAFNTIVRSLLSLESASDRDVRGWEKRRGAGEKHWVGKETMEGQS